MCVAASAPQLPTRNAVLHTSRRRNNNNNTFCAYIFNTQDTRAPVVPRRPIVLVGFRRIGCETRRSNIIYYVSKYINALYEVSPHQVCLGR